MLYSPTGNTFISNLLVFLWPSTNYKDYVHIFIFLALIQFLIVLGIQKFLNSFRQDKGLFKRIITQLIKTELVFIGFVISLFSLRFFVTDELLLTKLLFPISILISLFKDWESFTLLFTVLFQAFNYTFYIFWLLMIFVYYKSMSELKKSNKLHIFIKSGGYGLVIVAIEWVVLYGGMTLLNH